MALSTNDSPYDFNLLKVQISVSVQFYPTGDYEHCCAGCAPKSFSYVVNISSVCWTFKPQPVAKAKLIPSKTLTGYSKNTIEMLPKHGTNINSLFENNGTPLLYTCQSGRYLYGKVECSEMLLKYEVDINNLEENNENPLHYVCQNGCIFFYNIALKMGAEVHNPLHSKTPLHKTCLQNKVEILLKYGANINNLDHYNETAYHVCWKGSIVCTDLLIKMGTNIHTPQNGKILLHETC
ncbi:hypothetical protein CEXT_80261 [Caerostris extrusa]|uniref:Alpha-latrotoxin n=1 Tax=Caerostris extrusa TaxID=172846 RepID=A0AAV4W116_CAEEX|nr:hypothetical protein CEXT_80261 [Caerostris extrusa]